MYGKKLRIHRRGYKRSATTFTRRERSGREIRVHVPSFRVPPSNFTIVDRGHKGRGPKLFGRMKKGGLLGWHHTQDAELRRRHLSEVARRHSWLKVYHRLDALAKLTHRTGHSVSEAAREDANWVRREHLD